MKKKEKKELTFTFLNMPSEDAKKFHAEFMYRMYIEGKISKRDKYKMNIENVSA